MVDLETATTDKATAAATMTTNDHTTVRAVIVPPRDGDEWVVPNEALVTSHGQPDNDAVSSLAPDTKRNATPCRPYCARTLCTVMVLLVLLLLTLIIALVTVQLVSPPPRPPHKKPPKPYSPSWQANTYSTSSPAAAPVVGAATTMEANTTETKMFGAFGANNSYSSNNATTRP